MTDRGHFAAAAFSGLLAQGDDGSFSEESYAVAAYRWADAMLRVRDSRTADNTIHDAAPAATAGTPGTGDTPVTNPLPKEKRAEVSDSEPVAWAVMEPDGFGIEGTFTDRVEAAEWCDNRQQIVPLYRHQQPTLTDAERDAVLTAAWEADAHQHTHRAATLRGLLERLA